MLQYGGVLSANANVRVKADLSKPLMFADIEAECQDEYMKIRIGFNGSFTGLLYSSGALRCVALRRLAWRVIACLKRLSDRRIRPRPRLRLHQRQRKGLLRVLHPAEPLRHSGEELAHFGRSRRSQGAPLTFPSFPPQSLKTCCPVRYICLTFHPSSF